MDDKSYVLDVLFRKLLDRHAREPAPVPGYTPPKPAQLRASPRLPDNAVVQLEWLDESDQFRRTEAKVQDRSRHGLSLLLDEGLSVGWPVVIAHRSTLYRGVVRHCGKTDGHWKAGFQVVEDERRRDDRYPFRCSAAISWQTDSGTQMVPCAIHDANGGGVQVELEREIPEHSTACLHYDGWRRFGAIAWTRRKGESYRSGVHFTGTPISDESVDYKG